MPGVLIILSAISAGLGILAQLISVAESVSGGKVPGEVKRKSVIDSFFDFVSAGVNGKWLRGDWIVLNEQKDGAKEIVGALVDSMVRVANETGWKTEEETPFDIAKKITP